MTSDFFHFRILCQEEKIDLEMCACDSDLKLVVFLRACHLLYSNCNRFRIKFVHKFGLLILLRGSMQIRRRNHPSGPVKRAIREYSDRSLTSHYYG